MPAYKQFMALAGELCLKTRRASLALILATEPNNVFGKVCPFKAEHEFMLCTVGNNEGYNKFVHFYFSCCVSKN
jgi:hypothetical protein